MRNQTAYEKKYISQVKKVLENQRKEALDNLEAKAAGLTKDFQEKLFDDAAADELIRHVLNPVLQALAKDQGDLALLFAGDDEHQFKLNATLLRLITDSTTKMAKNFNDETLNKLNKTLAEGVAEGEGLSKLKSRVEDVYSGAKGYRAERIARTETLKASNYSTNEAYKQTGYVTAKQWYANPGADEECAALDGTIIGLDEDFLKQGGTLEFGDGQTYQNDYADVTDPPLHPNCRCTILPIR